MGDGKRGGRHCGCRTQGDGKEGREGWGSCNLCLERCEPKLVGNGSLYRWGVPFSLPNMSSSGRPVSLQLGKGIYCSSPFASVICPDTVLVSLCIS